MPCGARRDLYHIEAQLYRMGIAHISNLRQQIYRKAPDEYHQVLFIVPYYESLEELHRSLTGREAGVGNAVLGVPAENLTSMGKFSELRTELPPAAVGTPGTAFPTDVS